MFSAQQFSERFEVAIEALSRYVAPPLVIAGYVAIGYGIHQLITG